MIFTKLVSSVQRQCERLSGFVTAATLVHTKINLLGDTPRAMLVHHVSSTCQITNIFSSSTFSCWKLAATFPSNWFFFWSMFDRSRPSETLKWTLRGAKFYELCFLHAHFKKTSSKLDVGCRVGSQEIRFQSAAYVTPKQARYLISQIAFIRSNLSQRQK